MDYEQIKLLMLAFSAQPPDQRDKFFEICRCQINHMVNLEVIKNAMSVREVKIRENMISINDGEWQECFSRTTIEDRRGLDLYLPVEYKLENRT